MSGRGRGRGKRKVDVADAEIKEEMVEKQEKQEKEKQEKQEKQEKEKEKEPKKKASKKKQFPVVAFISPDGIEGDLLNAVRRPLIVHLPIQSKNVIMNDMPIAYDPVPPGDAEPYDIHADNPFSENVEELPVSAPISVNPPKNQPVEVKQSDELVDYYSMKTTFLVQFKDSTETKQIPLTSDAACFWCCHTFTNRPVVLPIRDTCEYIQVTGNFCSPECATSYLFDMRQDYHTRWEQLSLLYRIYGDACNGKINPAPPRNSLKLFGGLLSIQEYRNLIQSHKVRVDIHLPPMVSILATMDTKPIDFYDASLTKNVTETVKERLQKAEDVLRLRRTKPLKAWESTLDACLNFKIRQEVT
jgi:hypothetical protein